MGAGGKILKGVFVAVAEVEPDGVRLDNGMRLKNQELLRATRPSHAVTYASCQGLTLHNRVRLDLESCHLTLRHAGRGTRLPAGSQKRQRSKSILHFTCLPLALTLTARCSWLSSSVRRPPERASGR